MLKKAMSLNKTVHVPIDLSTLKKNKNISPVSAQ